MRTYALTHLYLVRHAHSVYSPDELGRPLSEKGFKDAHNVTERLKMEKIDAVVSSPYKRAFQTVEEIASYIGKDIEMIYGFKERTLSANPVKDFHFAVSKVWEDEHFHWEGGESNFNAQKRGIAATYQILKKYEGKKIVVGTHGNIMVLIMNYFDKNYNFSFWESLDMPDIYQLIFTGRKLRTVKRLWGMNNE